ncbi:MAG TPA: hypothetical protein VMF89_35970 [Polyangiales bacterium]|nr:hypothetical protein [Polyangiales bacterium]
MRLPTSTQLSTTAGARLRRVAACLLHVVVLVLSAEVSGALHAALDVAVEAGLVAHPDDDCERDGHECPPGCLSCHCGNATTAWNNPLRASVAAQPAPRAHASVSAEYDDIAPTGPERGRIDRPPRTHADPNG